MATATTLKHRQPARRHVRPRMGWLALAALLAVLVGGVLAVGSRAVDQPRGRLVAEHTRHDFGQAAITGGLLTARFPLTIESDALVTDLGTTCMCTRARLVQADTPSAWYGMPHRTAPGPDVTIPLAAGQPAYLEVSVDPASHGEAGLGPIQRGVVLTTAAGQELTFSVTANVTR